MCQVYVCDGELVCEKCAVDVSEEDSAIGGETDSPQHCSYCHRPLFHVFDLTSVGVNYVIETIKRDLKKGTKDTGWRWGHGYYKGLGRVAVGRDWTETVLDTCFSLNSRDKRILQWYLFITEKQFQEQINSSPENSTRVISREKDSPLSPTAQAELERGLQSAKTDPIVSMGDFTQFADDDEEE